MEQEDKLYLIGIKCSLEELANHVGLVNTFEENPEQEVAYFDFWDKVCIIEYNRESGHYFVKENIIGEPQYFLASTEKILFKYMDCNGIEFVQDGPLGIIFQSYAAAYLEIVRWAADVAYTRDHYNKLMGEE